MRLANKIAVITGGGSGIGRATASLFAAEGAQVVIAEINSAQAQAVEGEIGERAISVTTDVTSNESVAALFAKVRERYGRLDILVSNAGRPWEATSLTVSEEDWEECLNLNLRSSWLCARAAHPLMRKAGGSIVTIASTQGYRSNKNSFPYSAAKGGLLALTRNLAVEYAPDRIRANAIIPGQIESVRTASYFNSFRDPAEARRRVLSTFPLGRLGKPEDVAKAALFLASDDSEWITGIWLMVDGGRDAALVDLSDLKADLKADLKEYWSMEQSSSDTANHLPHTAAVPTFEPLAPHIAALLNAVSTATISAQLLKHGFHNMFMTGIAPLRPELRLCGRAVTLRYIPVREDLGAGQDVNRDAQRRLVESIGAGEVLVIDAREEMGAATLGSILATRMQVRGAAGLVSDGCFRDYPGIQAMDFPTYARGRHAGMNTTRLFPADNNVPIGCGGVAVLPGDVIVGDAEGVIVIPYGIVEQVATASAEQEQLEDFIIEKVRGGSSIIGVYRAGTETLAEFDQRRQSTL